MTVLSENVETLLKRLETSSKSELNLIRALADAIREVDDQTLRELRNLSLHHELRRESILGELQLLATRMCQLPARPAAHIRAALNHPPFNGRAAEIEPVAPPVETLEPDLRSSGGDWREAARNIQDELDETFGTGLPRH